MHWQALSQLARWLWWLALVVISYLALYPDVADISSLTSDKTEHVAAFFALAALIDIGYPKRSLWMLKLPVLLVYGLAIEAVQAMIPGRFPDWHDFAADLVGIASYLLLRAAVLRLLPSDFNSETD